MIMIKINLTGTHKENMTAIRNAPISEGFKKYVRKELKKHYDDLDKELMRVMDSTDDGESERNSIPIHELVPKGMTIKEYFGKEQRLLRGESISYMKFD